jgi:uncharacterized protein YgiM (DUF1202 family)
MTLRAAKLSLGLLLSLMLGLLLGACNLLTSPDSVQSVISGPPVVQIAAPPPNATYLESVAVNIQALVTNAGADIDRVEILVDGTIIQTLQQPNPGGAPSFSIAQAWQAAGTGPHTLSVQAFRADGSSSAPATVNINVISQAQMTPTSAEQPANPTAQTQPTTPPTQSQAQPTAPPTTQPPTTAPQASPTPNVPTATFIKGVNVRSGPSTLFNPPIGSFAAGQTAEILARTPAGDWYKVRYYNGEGWVFGQLLSVSGDTSRIAVDPGPPIPQPTAVPPTPIPPTPVPVANINLVARTIRLSPESPNCNETFIVTVDVANFGQQATGGGGLSVVDVRAADNTTQGSTAGSFGPIQPGQTVNSGNIPLTVSTYHSEGHKIVVVVDPNNQIAETNENDNRAELAYTLNKAGCP